MQSAKYVIIGGGAAGTTAATTIRQHDPQGSIILIEKDSHYLYSRLALAGYIKHKNSYDSLFLKDSRYFEEQDINVLLNATATGLDTTHNIVTLNDGQRIGYQKLLIATGSSPRRWSIPGADREGVLPLRTIEHASEIKERLSQSKHVTIVGGGFVTLELIQAVADLGIAATVIVRTPHYWASTLDHESGLLIQAILQQGSGYLNVLYSTTVEHILGHKQVEGVILSNGKHLKTDLILANVGVDFDTDWLKHSGLLLEGGIITNQYMQTELADVYAAGDITLFYDSLAGLHHHQGNWTNATQQGQIAGLNMTGNRQPLEAVSGYSINLFGKNISFIGQAKAHPNMTVIPRGSAKSGAYGRILIHQKRIVGATLINRIYDKTPLTRLIASQAPVDRYLTELADETFDLRQLADHLVKLTLR